jgi:hypothetical protein
LTITETRRGSMSPDVTSSFFNSAAPASTKPARHWCV